MQTQHKYRWGWVGAAALVLTGCGVVPHPPKAVTRYDLGAAPVAADANTTARPAVALAPLQAPSGSDGSTGMRYRLAYADAQVLHTYGQARWSAAPANLVQQRLATHLGQGGRVVLETGGGEVLPSVQGQRVPVLRWTLEEFSQVFSSPQDSTGQIRLRVSLVDPLPQGDVLLAQQVFTAQQAAAAANAAAGAQALRQGVDQIGQQLVQWVDSVLQTKR